MRAENDTRAPRAKADRDPRSERLAGRFNLADSSPASTPQSPTGLVLGVDVGATGALAVLTPAGELVAIHDTPALNDGPAARRSVNAPLLAEIVLKSHGSCAYVEFVGARPGEGPTGAFAFGRARGCVEGVLAAAGVPVAFLTAPQWKRLIGIPAGRAGAKDAARAEAIRRWPGKAGLFARAKDDGRAEAALIGLAGLMRSRSP